MNQTIADQLLFPFLFILPVACLRALLWISLADLTILEETRVIIAFNLVELTTDLLQGTQLGLIVDVVVTACLHRLYQALLELIVLGCCLTSCLSCSSFLLRCKAKLRPGVRKHVLVIFDLRLKCRLIHRIRLLRSLSLFTCTTFFPQRRVAQALIRASGAYLVTRTHTR